MQCLECELSGLDGSFCHQCGSKLVEAPASCIDCGKSPVNGPFCHFCGASQEPKDICPSCSSSGQLENFCTICGVSILKSESVLAKDTPAAEGWMMEAVWCKLCKDWSPRYSMFGEQATECRICGGPNHHLNFNRCLL